MNKYKVSFEILNEDTRVSGYKTIKATSKDKAKKNVEEELKKIFGNKGIDIFSVRRQK